MVRTNAKRIAVLSLCIATLLAVSLPILLYWIGLANINGRPARPPPGNTIAADTSLLQRAFHSDGPISIHSSNPWSYAASLLAMRANGLRMDGGSKAIWLIVSNYNSKQLADRRMS
jgi:hypothetical protein